MAEIVDIQLKVGLEVHVELATRTKMFTRAPNVAHPDFDGAEPNTLTDPVVLALPGALPVMNAEAIEMSMRVGLALGCSIARRTKWDRKSYSYPDLPKGYQISQYDQPLCHDGAVDVPAVDDHGFVLPDEPATRIGIVRAHLEEDAGKLLHEAPGGRPIDHSIVDLNRAGTPLLEIVTAPDFNTADQVVAFCKLLRNACRFLGVTQGVMQKGHMRFEPNINTLLTLDDGRSVATPVVEIKNLNSFRAVTRAIGYELKVQPRRWARDGLEMGPGAKSTRGWDDDQGVTVLQREKEDAHDYRYFPDPDLLPVEIDEHWIERVRASIPELPHQRLVRYVTQFGLTVREATTLTDEPEVIRYFERAVECATDATNAGKAVANSVLQAGARHANDRGVLISDLGVPPEQVGVLAGLRADGAVSSSAADELFGLLIDDPAADVRVLAEDKGLLIVRDEGALDAWCDEVIEAYGPIVEQIRSGKHQAIGRLIGEVMKRSGGSADAKAVRERLVQKINA